jgi:hypothetical protein
MANPTLKPIATKTFTGALVSHGSWGASALGEHESTMDLYERDALHGFIEWDIPALDDTEHIGLTYERGADGKRHLADYDGVMSLPHEAVILLEGTGIVVSEEFR